MKTQFDYCGNPLEDDGNPIDGEAVREEQKFVDEWREEIALKEKQESDNLNIYNL